MSNYFNIEDKETTPRYDQKESYIATTEREKIDEIPFYVTLSDDYDVFSRVDKAILYRTDTKQFELISICFRFIQDKLVHLMREDRKLRRERVLPKVTMSRDDDGTIMFNWAFSLFRASLLFEDERGNNNAYCTIVFQKTAESIITETYEVNENNYTQVMCKLLLSVIENS